MRIIGVAGRDGLLLETNRDEVANLLGYYYGGSEGCPQLVVGMQIRIADMYRQLDDLARVHSALSEARGTLQSAAKLIELVDPLIPQFSAQPDA